MVTILLTQDTDWIKRGPHQQHHLLERLGRAGHKIFVVDFDLLWDQEKKGGLVKKRRFYSGISKVVPDNRVKIIRPPVLKIPLLDKLFTLFFHFMEINNVAEREKVDIIIGTTLMTSISGFLVSRIHGIPFVLHMLDTNYSLASDYIPKPLLFIAKVIEMINFKNADRILTVNKQLKSHVINLGGKREKIISFPTGVDVQKYERGAIHRDRVRKELGILNSDYVLFFMGWLYHFSGLDDIARIIVDKKVGGLKLLVVGEGDLYHVLRRISKKSDDILLTGKVDFDEIPKYLSAADACILPSKINDIMRHIVPIKLYEYMAARKPILSTPLPGVMKEFEGHDGIIYCNYGEAMINTALEIKKNRVLEKLGEKNFQYVKKRDWDLLAKDFEEIINEIVENFGKK